MELQKEIPKIDLKEFRAKGYLQEINRLFLHPLGLAMQIDIGDKEDSVGGIWDYRSDPEGIYFGGDFSDNGGSVEKAEFIASEIEKRRQAREGLLGDIYQKVNMDKK